MTEQATEDTTVTDPTGMMAALLAWKPARFDVPEWIMKLREMVDAARDCRLVWYWDPRRAAWVLGMIVNKGTRDGYRGFDVDIYDKGPARWGYEWQIRPGSTEEPAPPDLSKVAQ